MTREQAIAQILRLMRLHGISVEELRPAVTVSISIAVSRAELLAALRKLGRHLRRNEIRRRFH